EVLDGRRDEFEELVLALCRQADGEPGTRTFRWVADRDGGYGGLEEYADEAAAVGHNERGADLLARGDRCARMARAGVCRPRGPAVPAWVSAHPQATAFPDVPDIPRRTAQADTPPR